jgi:hypothetical protein
LPFLQNDEIRQVGELMFFYLLMYKSPLLQSLNGVNLWGKVWTKYGNFDGLPK